MRALVHVYAFGNAVPRLPHTLRIVVFCMTFSASAVALSEQATTAAATDRCNCLLGCSSQQLQRTETAYWGLVGNKGIYYMGIM